MQEKLEKALILCENLSWAELSQRQVQQTKGLRLDTKNISFVYLSVEKIHFDQHKGNEVKVIFKEIEALLFISSPSF